MSYRMTPQDLKTLQARVEPKKSKFGNKKVIVDNIGFDSKREAQRYHELKLMQKVGTISELTCHPEYKITLHDFPICTVILDFQYFDQHLQVMFYEDVKSPPTNTAISKLKRKLIEATFGFKVTLVK